MREEGWRRLWKLVKCLVGLAASTWCVVSYAEAVPMPSDFSSPAASPIIVGTFLAAVIGGGIGYGALSVLEWVYRGFRSP